jgi:F-type H+-transporting ATPase subunit a
MAQGLSVITIARRAFRALSRLALIAILAGGTSMLVVNPVSAPAAGPAAKAAVATPVGSQAEAADPSSEADHGDTAKEGKGKKAEEHADPPMMPTFISAVYNIEVGGTKLKKEGFGKFLKTFHKQIMSITITALFVAFVIWASKRRAVMPGPLQIGMEATATFLHDLIVGILGPKGKEHVPFLGSLFLFIFVFNICGIIPLLGAPTATIQVTGTLALLTYGYVIYHNFKWNGLRGYFFHALGSPKDAMMWMFSPLFLVIHLIEEVARPLSLSLRLFGNILGKDILIGVFMMLGIGLFGFILTKVGILADPHYAPIGIPLQFPFYFLALLLSGVQALVFTLLSTVYLLLAMPHDHDHDHGHEAESGHGVDHGSSAPAAAH